MKKLYCIAIDSKHGAMMNIGIQTDSTTHSDGTATLCVSVAGKRYKSTHKNERAARQAWYRWCA